MSTNLVSQVTMNCRSGKNSVGLLKATGVFTSGEPVVIRSNPSGGVLGVQMVDARQQARQIGAQSAQMEMQSV